MSTSYLPAPSLEDRKARIRATRPARQRRALSGLIQRERNQTNAKIGLVALFPLWLLLGLIVLVVFLTSCTPQPQPTTWSCTVVENSDVRSGAGAAYAVIDTVAVGEEIIALGHPVGDWQQVCTPRLVEGYLSTTACSAGE